MHDLEWARTADRVLSWLEGQLEADALGPTTLQSLSRAVDGSPDPPDQGELRLLVASLRARVHVVAGAADHPAPATGVTHVLTFPTRAAAGLAHDQLSQVRRPGRVRALAGRSGWQLVVPDAHRPGSDSFARTVRWLRVLAAGHGGRYRGHDVVHGEEPVAS